MDKMLFTGDTHGEEGRFNPNSIPGEFSLDESDIIFVTGDWSYIFLDTFAERKIFTMGYESAYEELELQGFLEWVMYEVRFSDWYFGHFHVDRDIDERFHALMFDVKEYK